MSRASNVRPRTWIGAVLGVLLLLKTVGFVVARLLGVARSEVQARGGDVAFVLGLAERSKRGRG
jgi:hypothetical protein